MYFNNNSLMYNLLHNILRNELEKTPPHRNFFVIYEKRLHSFQNAVLRLSFIQFGII